MPLEPAIWSFFGSEDHGLRLRPATASDLPFVQATVCHPSTIQAVNATPEFARAALAKVWAEGPGVPDMRHFVAERLDQGATPVGYARLLYPFLGPRTLWLSFLAVAHAHRGQGWGRRIMAALLSAAEASGCVDKFGIHTYSANAPARRLYEACGFRVVKREPWRNEDGTHGERLTYYRDLDHADRRVKGGNGDCGREDRATMA